MSFDVLGDINYLAVVVAALAYFAIGGLWYTVLFGKAWIRASGVDPDQAQAGGGNALMFLGTFIAYLIEATVLAAIARSTGASTVGHGIVLGLFIGAGIAAVLTWVNTTYEMRPRALFAINASNAIVGFTVMAIIVTIWD